MSAQAELFAPIRLRARELMTERARRDHLTPARMSSAEHGQAGAADADKHLQDHMPGWLLQRLGDAFLAQRGREFTSDDVRAAAGATVDAWLTDKNWPERQNCFSGWFTMRRKKFKLVRRGSTPSTREDARGRWIGVWAFPA